MQNNILFMAFSAGREVVDDTPKFKRYIGVAPVSVVAVNPSKSQLEEIYNTTFEKDVEYVSLKDGIKTARIDFVLKTIADKCDGIETLVKASYFIRDEYRFNKDKTKIQVMDKYGRIAWVTKEECDTHAIPQYANGPANLDKDYSPCYVGEEEITNFIKTYLNIPSVQKYVDNKWILVEHPEECEARLSTVKKFFDGDFSEIREIMGYQPNNKLKVMFGVKTTDDGKQYQTVYTDMVLRGSTTNFSKLDVDLKERKQAGRYPSVEFEATPIHEYVVTPTDLGDLPEATAPSNPQSWFN